MPKQDPLNLGQLGADQAKQDAELRGALLEFLSLSYVADKTPDQLSRQIELASYLGDIGLGSPNNAKRLKDMLQGTPFDADLVQKTILASADPSQIDTSALLSGALNTSTNRTTNIVSDTVSRTDRTTTRYVDVPTPDEFLDDFDNAFSIHVEGLVQTGQLRPEVAQFAQQNRSLFFGEYLREQVGRLLKGEPLYKVTGTSADERLIGSRRGEVTQDKGTSRQTERATSAASQTAVPSETPLGKAIESASTETENRTEQSTYDTTLDETEALIQRNKLAVVANLSPLDFLKGSAEAKRLNLLYGGQKGAAQRAAQTAAGQDFSGSARRV